MLDLLTVMYILQTQIFEVHDKVDVPTTASLPIILSWKYYEILFISAPGLSLFCHSGLILVSLIICEPNIMSPKNLDWDTERLSD